MTTTFEDAKVGDKVFDIYFNQWYIIIDNVPKDKFPIKTKDSSYSIDGRPNLTYGRTLFWDEVIITPPEKPLPKLEIDTRVLVWDTQASKVKRYFSHFNKDGHIATFSGGRTSWSTNDNSTIIWEYWELAKD